MNAPACGKQHGDAVEEVLQVASYLAREYRLLNGFADLDDAGVAGPMAMVADTASAMRRTVADSVCNGGARRPFPVRIGIVRYKLRRKPLRKRRVTMVVSRAMVVSVPVRRYGSLRCYRMTE